MNLNLLTSCFVKFERDVRVDSHRKVVVDDVKRQIVFSVRRIIGIRIGIDFQQPPIQQQRIGIADVW